MDRMAERLSGWFGSTPFIVVHVVWFGGWVAAHMALKFDSDFNLLTVVVSLEAIFLSLFILRAETVQGNRMERKIDKKRK